MSKTISCLFFSIFTIALLCVYPQLLNDPDTGWHIMAGSWIVENKSIPSLDPFSFTAGDYAWYNISWGWDTMMGFLHGPEGLYYPLIFSILTNSAIIYLLIKLSLSRGAGVICTLTPVLLGCTALFITLTIRPHQVTNLFALIFYISLFRYNKIYLLPFLMLVWVNMHGGFLAGFTILGAFLIQEYLKKDSFKFKPILLTSIACMMVIPINPLGLEIFSAAYRTLGSALKDYVHEWSSPNELGHFIYIALFIPLFSLTFSKQQLSDKILCLFWLAASLISIRYLPIFYVISASTIAYSLWTILSSNEEIIRKEGEFSRNLSKPLVQNIAIFSTVILLIAVLSPATKNLISKNEIKLPPTIPSVEITYILNNHPNKKFLNFYDYGGAMIYLSEGNQKTFIDGRANTAFPKSVVQDYISFLEMKKGWQNIPKAYDVDGIFFPKQYPQILALQESRKWKKVYEGDLAVILVRR